LRRAAAIVAVLAAVLGVASASALESCIGPLCVSATATLQPRALPKHGNAPITFSTVIRVSSKDGKPPTMQTLRLLVDKHGSVDAQGLPRCTLAKLEGTTPAEARKRCAAALVGTGTGKALVSMPGQAPFTISSPLSFFNGPPSGGDPTVIAHAYETVPSAKTLLVPFTIQHVSRGRYGFEAQVQMPEIAGGFGVPTLAEATVGATRTRGGKRVGYLNAHCSGGRLQVYGTIRFTNGDYFPTTLTSPCHFSG
jgi:hypothetical protein